MRSFFAVILTIAFALLTSAASHAQIANDHTVLSKPWNAHWIAPPNDPGTEYGVYYFRKSIDLAVKPSSFVVKVSADNRYKLYVNSTLVSVGPARGDTYYWNYETIDLISLHFNQTTGLRQQLHGHTRQVIYYAVREEHLL